MKVTLIVGGGIGNLLTTKSNESKSVFLIEQTSRPYNKVKAGIDVIAGNTV